MKAVTFLSLLLLLTACAPSRTTTEKPRMLTEPPPASTATAQPSSTLLPSPALVPSPTPVGLSNIKLSETVLQTHWSATDQHHYLRPVDPATGQDVAGYTPIRLGQNMYPAFSPDGKILAVVAYETMNCTTYCVGGDGQLHWLDLTNWREVTTTLPLEGWPIALIFSPDSTKLAVTFDDFTITGKTTLAVFDAAGRNLVAQIGLGFSPRLMRYSTDGQTLALYGTTRDEQKQNSPVTRVALLNAISLSVIWETTLEDVRDGAFVKEDGSEGEYAASLWTPGIAFSQDGNTLYIVHADEDKLTTVDFIRQTTRTVVVQPSQSWLDRMLALTARVAYAKVIDGTVKQAVLSADETRLFVVGYTQNPDSDANSNQQNTPLGLLVINATTGVELTRVETAATEMSLSPDGRRLFLRGWSIQEPRAPRTEVLNADDFSRVKRVDDLYIFTGTRLNGHPIVLSEYGQPNGPWQFATLDPMTLNVIRQWSLPDYGEFLYRR